jgi:hypothetical protein
MKRPLAIASVLLILSGCAHHQPQSADLYNDAANLGSGLPYPVLSWKPLTSSVDRSQLTTSTLFGNDAATAAARSGQHAYPSGAVIALVTWRQREDRHWFGARIPDAPLQIEFVEFSAAEPRYRNFAGSPLHEQPIADASVRIAAITSMNPVALP